MENPILSRPCAFLYDIAETRNFMLQKSSTNCMNAIFTTANKQNNQLSHYLYP